MSEEMVERVARALIDADSTMEGYHESHIEAKRKYACAAIKAMRDPTEEMIAAGRDANDEYASEVAPCSSFRALDSWRAMIDEALK